MIPTIIVSVLLGVVVGYAVFYFRYDNRHFIDELRNNLTNTRQDLETASADAAEFEQQNIILREKVTTLISKNDDLAKIVSDLSRWYFRMKQASEKAQELSTLLKVTDSQLEEKIQSMSISERLEEKMRPENHSNKKR